MNDGINYGVNNQSNTLGEIDMNMPCTSLDGKVWTNLKDAMQYNETYYNSITNELKTDVSICEYNMVNIPKEEVSDSELNLVDTNTQENIDNIDKASIKPFKSLDGKEWGNIDKAVEYNKLYFEKMRIRDNLIIDDGKHGFGSR